MIIICPSCSMRYMVADGSVGASGRRVHCASCGHMWVQEAEVGLDEVLFSHDSDDDFIEDMPQIDMDDDDDDAMPFEQSVDKIVDKTDIAPVSDLDDFQSLLQKKIAEAPIPEGVKPMGHDPVLDALLKAKAEKDKKTKKIRLPVSMAGAVPGFIAAAAFYFLLFVVFLAANTTISRAWPPANLIYNLVGIKPVLPGDGLAIESVSAHEIEGGKIVLKGRILNLTEHDVAVPVVLVNVRDDKNVVIEQHKILPPVNSLKAEGAVPFEYTVQKKPEAAVNTDFAFTWAYAAE